VATRTAERAAYFRPARIIAAMVLWLREDPQDRPQPPRWRTCRQLCGWRSSSTTWVGRRHGVGRCRPRTGPSSRS